MQIRWPRVIGIGAILALPFFVSWAYSSYTALPDHITIATGPAGGRFREIGNSLRAGLANRLDGNIHTKNSKGSRDNVEQLIDRRVDFALVQSGAERLVATSAAGGGELSFVCNMYSEVVHLVVANELRDAWSIRGKRVCLGATGTGDGNIGRVVLNHLGMSEDDVEKVALDYAGIVDAFETDEGGRTIDAAVIVVSEKANVIQQLMQTRNCRLISIPNVDALARRELTLLREDIPTSYYGSYFNDSDKTAHPFPAADLETVSVRTLLMTHANVPSTLVEEALGVVLNDQFVRENDLRELYEGGVEFARVKPYFAMHPGALHYFDPRLKPIINTEFVEATEGIRSFLVSTLIAVWLTVRWYQTRTERRNEHRLDRYIRSLLEIERMQLDLDDKTTSDPRELDQLQQLLDEVTSLRQEALQNFTAHAIHEDPAIDVFLQMCHALSDKISAKLTRLRMDRRFDDVLSAMHDNSENSEHEGGKNEGGDEIEGVT